MSNPPGWVFQTKLANVSGKVDVMAGLAAGVVTAGEVNTQQPTGGKWSLDQPGTWSYIWFGVATLYLIGIYVGMIHVKGE